MRGPLSIFSLTEGLTDGEKNDAITAPFRDYDPSPLASIANLPFASYVTTNYDRVLLDVDAKHRGKAAAEVNLGDPTLTAAPFQDTFYVARIQGRVEVPGSMVLSKSHYQRLFSEDTAYVDFLPIHDAFAAVRRVFVSRPGYPSSAESDKQSSWCCS